MFRKLVSNISFSPALVGQLGFYAKRLTKEESTRKLGLVFVALALVVQSFTVFSPPEAANAASSSDMIKGGVTSLDDFMKHYDRNTQNVRDIMNYNGITRAEIKAAKKTTINSKQGWLSWGYNNNFSKKQGNVKHSFKKSNGGTGTVYSKPLRLWDSLPYTIKNGSSYDGWVGKSKKMGTFSIMKICGNLNTKKVPPPPPKPVAACKLVEVIKVSENIRKFKTTATTSGGAKVQSYTTTISDSSGKVVKNIAQKQTNRTNITAQVKLAPGSYKVKSTVTTTIGTKASSDCSASFTVAKPGVSINKLVNGKENIDVEVNEPFKYTVVVKNTGGTTLRNFAVTDKAPDTIVFVSADKGESTPTQWSYTIPSLAAGASEKFTITAKATKEAEAGKTAIKNTACVETGDIPGSPDDCDDAIVNVPEVPIKVCEISTSNIIKIKPSQFDDTKHSKDLADCEEDVTQSKSAINLSQENKDATTVVAKANDRIRFTISTQNVGKSDIKVEFKESLYDTLEYANLIDNGGGTFDKKTGVLSWPQETLKAGEKQSRMFTVQLASTVAAGARGVSDPLSYDCIMLNTFGNSVQIKVDCPAPKQVENVAAELPRTGPTENLLFAGGLLSVVAFFYARSRQLKSEVRLIRRDINAGTI